MPLVKFATKNAFRENKRRFKQRGRSGGRKKKINVAENEVATAVIPSVNDDARPSCQSPRTDENRGECSSWISPIVETASNRKLSLFSSFYNSYGNDDVPAESIVINKSADTPIGYHDPEPGFRLVKIDCIIDIVKNLVCSVCNKPDLEIREKKQGLMSIFSVSCMACTKQFSVSTSRPVSRQHSNEANLLAVAAARNSGIGYQGMCNFMGNMDLPRPMQLKTYQHAAKCVHQAAMRAVGENLKNAAELVKESYSTYSSVPSNLHPIDVAVSFDGTWHKRGHTSLFGVGIVIDLLTGFVLDFSCKSKYCHGCEIGPKPSDPNYSDWKTSHTTSCQINFSGSSNAMEADAALTIFQRSVLKHNIQYTTMLSDGDSKAFITVRDNNIYGDEFPIAKEDCVNHVSKRMGTALRKVKQAEKLGGRGRGKLTDATIDKLQSYYSKAIKENAPDIDKIQRAVYASLFHMVSTDDEPHHRLCPNGENSWCHYQRSLLDKNQKRPHRPTISKEVGEKLLPIYKRMTDTELLKRCSRNTTQNANESFNALIWRRCPKTEFISLQTLETGVAMAILEYNKGAAGFLDIVNELDLEHGHNQTNHARKINKRRLDDAQRTSVEKRKNLRKSKKLAKTKIKDQLEKKEGVTYKPGGF